MSSSAYQGSGSVGAPGERPSSAQRAHTHTAPRASAGTRSSAAGSSVAVMHQQLVLLAAMPQPFGPPHSGQRLGSKGVLIGAFVAQFPTIA
jgi:hypothetical protein